MPARLRTAIAAIISLTAAVTTVTAYAATSTPVSTAPTTTPTPLTAAPTTPLSEPVALKPRPNPDRAAGTPLTRTSRAGARPGPREARAARSKDALDMSGLEPSLYRGKYYKSGKGAEDFRRCVIQRESRAMYRSANPASTARGA